MSLALLVAVEPTNDKTWKEPEERAFGTGSEACAVAHIQKCELRLTIEISLKKDDK
jgi:hypothetical protein